MQTQTILEKYSYRPATREDIPTIVEVSNTVMIDQWGKPDWTLEDAEREFSQPGFTLEEQVRVVTDASGALVAVGIVFMDREPPVRSYVVAHVLPTLPDRHQIGLELLTWGEEVIRRLALPRCPEEAKVQMMTSTFAEHAPTVGMYEAYGMRKVRQFWNMDIMLHADLPAPQLPDGITIRPVRYPEENRDLYRILDIAFADHYGHVDDPEMKNFDNWVHHRMNGSHFDPTLWFVAEEDGKYAGFSWCHIGMPEDPTMGWVGTLGVLPEYRRRGLATALLQHSFREFYARGVPRAGLGVDATNITGATRVYERAGMRCFARWDSYAKVLRDGVELVREE